MRTLVLAAFLMTFLSCVALASPLPPFVGASTSPNGRFLVVAEREYNGPEGTIRKIVRTVYRVRQLETFLTDKDRFNTSTRFWSEGWALSLGGKEGQDAPWPMISNDGETIVLVHLGPPWPKVPTLTIFREKDYRGELVKTLPLSDLWTTKQIDPEGTGNFTATDATPEWFAGGSLNFSVDSRELVYRSRWNDVVRIDLHDGLVKRAEAHP